jgi:hypothetical protein
MHCDSQLPARMRQHVVHAQVQSQGKFPARCCMHAPAPHTPHLGHESGDDSVERHALVVQLLATAAAAALLTSAQRPEVVYRLGHQVAKQAHDQLACSRAAGHVPTGYIRAWHVCRNKHTVHTSLCSG